MSLETRIPVFLQGPVLKTVLTPISYPFVGVMTRALNLGHQRQTHLCSLGVPFFGGTANTHLALGVPGVRMASTEASVGS